MLDDVKGEIVGAAKAPDHQGEQQRRLDVIILGEQQNERRHSDDKK